jgi:fatty acid amide hydrolase
MQDATQCTRSSPARRATAGGSLCELSASEMARRVASGENSALELVEAHIARIESVNPVLNAVVVKRYDAARDEARTADRRRASGETLPPLAGVPVTVKECLDLNDTASTFGLPMRARVIAREDELHVARLREAGAIVLGKTNVAQLLLFVETDNPLYGRTNNPWNVNRTCGGSSGGEGAIIATGGSALGLGTDVGGSCRYPANFCGIAGFKPTTGRCGDHGRFSISYGQQVIPSQVGVLARSIDDIALGLEVINGGKNPAVEPPMPLSDYRGVDVQKLRVGVYSEDGIMRSSPAVRRAVSEAAACLNDAGAEVVEWTPPGIAEAFHLFYAIFSADGAELLKETIGRDPIHRSLKPILMLGGRSPRTLAVLVRLLRLIGQPSLAAVTSNFGHTSAADYWRLTEQLLDYRLRFARAMRDAEGGPLDLILGPACALPPFLHGATKDIGLAGAHTLLYNVLGYPCGVVPVTRVKAGEESERQRSLDIVEKVARSCELGSAGLPVGVQIAARPWREHQALAALAIVSRDHGLARVEV